MEKMSGMILSVGNSVGPILVSLEEYRPACVLFIVSEDSKGMVKERILPNLPEDYLPTSEILSLSNPQAINSSFLEIRNRLRDWLERYGFGANVAVALDITGGTKAMSVALALAGIAEGASTLVYVGGQQRDPDTGRVVSGHEEILVSLAPFGDAN